MSLVAYPTWPAKKHGPCLKKTMFKEWAIPADLFRVQNAVFVPEEGQWRYESILGKASPAHGINIICNRLLFPLGLQPHQLWECKSVKPSTNAHTGAFPVPWPRCPRAYAELSSCLLWTLGLWAGMLDELGQVTKEGQELLVKGRGSAGPGQARGISRPVITCSVILEGSQLNRQSQFIQQSIERLSVQTGDLGHMPCWLLAQGLCIILSVSMQHLQLPSVVKYCSA